MSKKQRAYVSVLLDRSGSMQVNKAETISAFNQYVDKTKGTFRGQFTLTQFDTGGIDSPQSNVKLKEAAHLTNDSYLPRGGTPLLDAIGKTIAEMKTEGFDNVILVIVTDGAENASREYDTAAIKALLEEKAALGWQVSYLGANVDAFAEASSLGIRAGQTMNYVGTQSAVVMDSFHDSNKRYAARPVKTNTVDADFTDAERKTAVGDQGA